VGKEAERLQTRGGRDRESSSPTPPEVCVDILVVDGEGLSRGAVRLSIGCSGCC